MSNAQFGDNRWLHVSMDTDEMLAKITRALNSIGRNEQVLAESINEAMLILRAELVSHANEVYDRKGKKIKKTDLHISRSGYKNFANAMVTAKGYKNDLSYFNYEPFQAISTGRNVPGGYSMRVRSAESFKQFSGTDRHSPAFLVKYGSGHLSIVQRARSKSDLYKSAAGLAGRRASGSDPRRITKMLAPSLPEMIGAKDVYDPAEEVFTESLDEILQKHIAEALRQAA